jgi:cob(I)alamin adenosyltransferase
MSMAGYKTKESVVVVFAGEGKGKTSASLGMMGRALGAGQRVAFIQFIKKWQVSEQAFINQIKPVFGKCLYFYQNGAGFYKAQGLSAKNVSDEEHKKCALDTFTKALKATTSGDYNLVICDEINNAVQAGLITKKQLTELIKSRSPQTSLCLTGRDFPPELLPLIDIATDMKKLKHHYDNKFLANLGIDF